MMEIVNVRIKVKRELWAEVKAKATREDKDVSKVVNEILEEYFKGGRK